MKCAGLWPNGACCLDQSRTCGPLLHTPEDVLLPMVFIKQVINGLCVCGSVPSVFTGPVLGHSRGQHRQRCMYVVPTQRGKNELISAF